MSRFVSFSLIACAGLLLASAFAMPASAARQLRVKAAVSTHYPDPNERFMVRVKASDRSGRPLKGVRCVATWHLASKTARGRRSTNRSGLARLSRYVSDASGGYRVRVTIRCTWRGRVRRCATWFLPHAALPDSPKLVFIGDSLTVGLYAVTRDASFRQLVPSRFGFPSERIAATGGQTKDIRLEEVESAAGDIVIVELGTNDVIGYPTMTPVSAVVFKTNLSAIAAAARVGKPDCRLVFLSIWQERVLRLAYDKLIRSVAARYGHHFVDLSTIKDNAANSWPSGVETYYGSSDGWHPNSDGHAAIADAVNAEITEMMGQTDTP